MTTQEITLATNKIKKVLFESSNRQLLTDKENSLTFNYNIKNYSIFKIWLIELDNELKLRNLNN